MPHPHTRIRANAYVFLRLPNSSLKLIELKPNTIIDIGKLGTFPSNLLLGRPYHHTYELLPPKVDQREQYSRLRIVPPSELNAEVVTEQEQRDEAESRGTGTPAEAAAASHGAAEVPEGYDLVDDAGRVLMKNNRLTIDSPSRQALTQPEIEALKRSHGGKEVVAQILANHSGLEEKTDFSKAKYTLRKTRKYVKRFQVLPMDVVRLGEYVLEKEAGRIMEIREETLALVGVWSNAHFFSGTEVDHLGGKKVGGGRWLALDETGGLIVAALAERMGLLWPTDEDEEAEQTKQQQQHVNGEQQSNGTSTIPNLEDNTANNEQLAASTQHRDFPIPSQTNTITLLHPAVQPNLSLLKYFGYDTNNPSTSHPLHTHLKPLSLLSLLHPDEDPLYAPPPTIPEPELKEWKSGKRGQYFKKRRRWERVKSIVDEAREGGFEGLVVASHMDPVGVLRSCLPLVRGGGNVVVYHPTIEPLKTLVDLYSKDRKVAYVARLNARKEKADGRVGDEESDEEFEEDFPLDPRLLLAPTIQTSRVRQWQVLPGRTHPLMSSTGGSEGYIFTAHRVVPLEGGVEARGNYGKRRKAAAVSIDGESMAAQIAG